MNNINCQLITIAREAAGFTQRELSDSIGVEQATISKIENGIIKSASDEIIQKIAYVLDYPETFFYQNWMPVRVEGHYRRKMAMTVKTLKEIKAKMTLAERHLTLLCESVELPTPNYPKWNVEIDGSPILCAKHLREYWKIPKGRITNLTEILEDNGFVIIELDLGEIDGFSALSENNTPIIFINKNMPGDRFRMTAAHEAIHFVMHNGQIISEDRNIETEAKQGAGELLLPLNDVQSQLGKLTLDKLADLKMYWRVSMQAILVKAGKNNLITQNQYEYLWKQMSAAGYRKKEPVEIPKEKPTLFKELITTHLDELKYSSDELSKLLQFKKVEDWYLNKGSKLKILRKIA